MADGVKIDHARFGKGGQAPGSSDGPALVVIGTSMVVCATVREVSEAIDVSRCDEADALQQLTV